MNPHPNVRSTRPRLSRRDFLRLLAATSAGALAPPLLFGCATDPITGQQRLILLSEDEEIAIDQQHAPHQFSNDYGLLRDPTVTDYIGEVGQALARVSHRPHMPFSHHVVNANYVNAYTFPGGTMACTRGILVELEDEAALAALLGHETGHVTARHTARRQTSSLLTAAVIGGVGIAAAQTEQLAGYSSLIYGVSAVGATALLAHYSRQNEREADDLGLEYMAAAGHNPQGMVDLMEKLVSLSNHQPNTLEAMFSTHPMSQERFATAQRQARKHDSEVRARDVGRERYLDQTASLRRIRPAIRLMQSGEAHLAQGQYRQAEEHFANALRQVPDDYPGLLLMAKTQAAQDQHQAAERYLDRARAVYPDEGQAVHLSGINALAQNRHESALEHFEAYAQRLPGNPNTDFLKGVAYDGMEAREAAARHYRRYLAHSGTETAQGRYAAERLQRWQ